MNLEIRRGCLVASALCLLVGCDVGAGTGSASDARLRSRKRTLVVIIPGTYGNDDPWPMILPDRQTFASELVRGIDGEVELHPYVWSSSIRGSRRIEAARMLAKDVDRLAGNHDRVVLIGHSHGGNIALLAAGQCRTGIDSIVCLATPHVYLRVVDSQRTSLNLPVYCSPRTLRNTRRIVCYWAQGDSVAEAWSNILLTGVGESEALELTREWRALMDAPRLADDRFIARLLESDNLFASARLTMALHNQAIPCEARDPLGIRQHNAIHTCSVGYAVGRVLSERTTVQLPLASLPADADLGVR